MSPASGRVLKENDQVVNQADMLEAIYNALVVDKNAGVSLTGSLANLQSTTIASGTSLSGEIEVKNQLLAIEMPAAWTAASITFQASSTSGGTYKDVYDDLGSEVTLTAGANRVITIDNNALKLASLKFIKLRSGTTATPVNQAAARVINIIGRA